ncbi:helix-turn-helix transcriptional regulator [Micromonospora sp. ATCC 39149]|uniref:LuxR family transcriptional regulator n=1 Tax=Micromonospora carbonacea TaxID=47853 RepID=A0A7D6C9G3_9ACTN|nr:helix-turn-helix transcriptional regulator [Micromonospora sp. ATCC 39149]QLJ96662.1 LuxR family transcriptional regulator [Micromonospora carbonacea]
MVGLDEAGVVDLIVRRAQEALAGHGSVVVLSGAGGAGKTALLARCAEAGRRAGLPTTAAVFRRLDPTGPGASLDVDRSGPRMVCLDDVQNTDEQVLRRVLELALATRERPVVMVIGTRPSRRRSFQEARAELLAHTRCDWIDLGHVSVTDVVRLAASQTGRVVDPTTAERLLLLCGNNVTLLKGVLADYARDAELERAPLCVADVPGVGYRQAVLDSYHRLDPAAQNLANALAVLRHHAGPRTLGELTGMLVREVDHALGDLTVAGLVDGWGFRHPAAESAIVANFSVELAAALNRRAAVVLRRVEAPATDIARCLVVADYVDQTWVDLLSRDSTIRALAAEDRGTALAALRLALRGTTDGGQRVRILERLARMYAGSDPELCYQYLSQIGVLRREGSWSVGRSSLLGEQLASRGLVEEALAELTRAVEQPSADDAATALLEADRLLLCGDFPVFINQADDLVGRHRDVRSPYAVHREGARALLRSMATADQPSGYVDAAKDSLYECPFSEDSAAALLAAATALVYAGELDAVRPLTNKFVEEARAQRIPVWQARAIALRAEVALRAGHYAEAVERAREALALLPLPAWGVRGGAPLSVLLLGHTALAEHSAAATYLCDDVPVQMFRSRYGLHYLYARGHHYLSIGRAEAALADFSSCGRLMVSWKIDRERVLPWRLAAAAALLSGGEPEAAVDLIEQRTRAMEAAGAAATGHRADIERRRVEREFVFDALVRGVEQARLVETIREMAQGRAENPSQPEPPRYRIEDRYSTYLSKLTSSEREVALLAASGHSNRSIARDLFVTVSTVEQHLTHTYQKLKISGRRELRARLG